MGTSDKKAGKSEGEGKEQQTHGVGHGGGPAVHPPLIEGPGAPAGVRLPSVLDPVTVL